MKAPLLVFGEDWGGLPSSTQHLVSQLAQDRDIYWVNSIGLRKPKLSLRDLGRVWQKVRARLAATESSPELPNIPPINVLKPLTLPAPSSRWGRWLAKTLTARQIHRAWPELKSQRPYVWTSLPTAGDLKGAFNESGWVYYCCDDFEALAGVDHKTVRDHERDLLARADRVVVTSHWLANKHAEAKPIQVDHGVDLELFSQPTAPAPEMTRACVGFYGSLDQWVDFARIKRLAQARPSIDFHLIGRGPVMPERLPENVKLLGYRSHEALPSYAQHWRACLLPFVESDQISACNPLKLREYLATGRPVISSSFPASQQFSEVVLADSDEDWLIAIDQALDTPNRVPPAWLAQHSWQAIAQRIDNFIRSA